LWWLRGSRSFWLHILQNHTSQLLNIQGKGTYFAPDVVNAFIHTQANLKILPLQFNNFSAFLKTQFSYALTVSTQVF
jgi:hypothetical protein